MLDINYLKNGLNGIFLMIIAISGEYIAKIFPCGLQKLFERNIYCKYILVFFILFIAIIFSNEKLIKNKSIFWLIGITLLLYIWLLCMTKMHVYFFISLIVILFVLYTYVKYNETNENNKKEDKDNKIYDIVTLTLLILAIVITLIGFLLYYGEKKYEYKKLFSWKTFIFDNVKCNTTPPKGTMKDYFLAIFNKNNI